MATYKIVSFNELHGQIEIQYDVNYPPVCVDLPLENGLFLTGDALDAYIQGFIPVTHIDRLNTLKNGVANANEIQALVQPIDSLPTDSTVEIAPYGASVSASVASDMEFIKQLIDEALAQRGL